MSSITEERRRSLEFARKNLDKFKKNIEPLLEELDKVDKKASTQLRFSFLNYVANTKTYCEHPDFFDFNLK